jgi:hypothetical protein
MREKYIVIGSLILIVGPFVCMHDVLKKDYLNFYNDNYTAIIFGYSLVRLLKFSLDVFVFYNLFRILWIFLQIKFALMKRKAQKITIGLISVLSAIYFVILLNLFHAVIWQA